MKHYVKANSHHDASRLKSSGNSQSRCRKEDKSDEDYYKLTLGRKESNTYHTFRHNIFLIDSKVKNHEEDSSFLYEESRKLNSNKFKGNKVYDKK